MIAVRRHVPTTAGPTGEQIATVQNASPLTRFRLRYADRHQVNQDLCALILIVAVTLYVIAYSSLSIAAYRTGHTLFDLALFEQSFWSAARGSLFSVSLEVTRPDLVAQMSHFGRHFSPIFFLLLPFYLLYQQPSTLLVLQSLALGGAAIPLYLFARRRLGSSPVALVFALLYLASPATHDVNTVNEFHELAFVVPLIFLAFYAIETDRWPLYAISVLGMLMVKEDVALEVIALGLFVALIARQRRIGLLTMLAGAIWFVFAVLVIIPAFRGPNGPIPFLGYDYLGHGIGGIVGGILTKPSALWHVVTAAPKLRYVFWLLIPVAFLALLAPEVLAVAAPPLLIVLASTFPLTYAIYAQYVAPIVPIVFIAAVIGFARTQRLITRLDLARTARLATTGTLLLALITGTLFAQLQLHKFPAHLIYPTTPDPQVAAALSIIDALPPDASVVSEDHRWLAHLANRPHLYVLSADSPTADYILTDGTAMKPITNYTEKDRAAAIERVEKSGEYVRLECDGGFVVYAKKGAVERENPRLKCTRAQG
jgi:uncharacterized membrane protein